MDRRQKMGEWFDQHRRVCSVFLACAVVIEAMLGMCRWSYQRGISKGVESYEDRLAIQAEELGAEKDEALAEKDEILAAKDQKIYELEQELRPVDEEGLLEDRMSEFYGRHELDAEPKIGSDTEFREYCQENRPDAVYPSTEWTAEDVIASWTEQPEIWGHYMDDLGYNDTWYTWTPDYEHCFILDVDEPYPLTDSETGEHQELISGWLVVDGIRVAMLDKVTYDIEDPFELVRQYQAGEWDGSIRRSHDGSTTVVVYPSKGYTLYYMSEFWRYDERFDPEGLAWTEFEMVPWWKQREMSPELLAAAGWDKTPAAEPWDRVNVRGVSYLYLSYLYVDLPLECDLNQLKVIKQTGAGLLCIEKGKPVIYSKGVVVGEWDTKFYEHGMEFLESPRDPSGEYANYVGFIYDQYTECLIALCADGTVETLLDEVVFYKRSNNALWGFKDGEFVCWRLRSYSIDVYHFGTDVIEVDASLPVMLLTKSDGTCHIMAYDDDGSGYVTKQLGTEPLEYYRELYQMLGSGRYIII